MNFQQIILPDILTSLLRGDETVYSVMLSLDNDVIKSCDLNRICQQLETMLRNIIFDTKVRVQVASHHLEYSRKLRFIKDE